mgnify:CR=1 FL=1
MFPKTTPHTCCSAAIYLPSGMYVCAGRFSALVVDFDETCTARDTIGGLMRLAAAAAGQPVSG